METKNLFWMMPAVVLALTLAAIFSGNANAADHWLPGPHPTAAPTTTPAPIHVPGPHPTAAPQPHCVANFTLPPVYRDGGYAPGQNGANIFTVEANLPACAFEDWKMLWVKPEVTTITGTPVQGLNMDGVPLHPGQPIRAVVDGLQPLTVYQAKVGLYTIQGGQFVQVGTIGNYYTVTDGDDDMSRIRAALVLHGLKQYDDQQHGLVGKFGYQPDGTRYGAKPGDSWSTQFYAWVTSLHLSTTPGAQFDVPSMKGYFAFVGVGAWDDDRDAIRGGRPGDYLAYHGHQSAMLLGYDPNQDMVFTLEGDLYDRVGMGWHGRDEMEGIGHIKKMMVLH